MRKRTKMTTTPPLGRNLSLHKTLLGDEFFINFLGLMYKLPDMYGITLERWINALKLMFEKNDSVL